ncbi:MAG: hypothetical protein QM647_13190 [Asticcacaulis sp.]|uniref:hypothetical protein n=1 Tax=Asticcacaulis sp. TaxID=1872648 RepID=UPI0039E415A8
MDRNSQNLTGVWHGLYSYVTQPYVPENHFIAVLIDSSGHLSGTVHETITHSNGTSSDQNADVVGKRDVANVTFMKTYDGNNGWSHNVFYVGALNAENNEIEGIWRIHGRYGNYEGKFLMIRNSGNDEAVEVAKYETV